MPQVTTEEEEKEKRGRKRGLTLACWLFSSPFTKDGAVDRRSTMQFVAIGTRKYHCSFWSISCFVLLVANVFFMKLQVWHQKTLDKGKTEKEKLFLTLLIHISKLILPWICKLAFLGAGRRGHEPQKSSCETWKENCDLRFQSPRFYTFSWPRRPLCTSGQARRLPW